LALVVMLLFMIGCGSDGPKTAEVSGVVTLDGTPLANATIIFTPVAAGRPSVAISDKEGKYTLMFKEEQPGAELGEHIVTITTGGETYDADDNESENPEKVPAKYNLDRSYKQTVEDQDNKIDLVLEPGPIGATDDPDDDPDDDGEDD
jgi:hypothetical protein